MLIYIISTLMLSHAAPAATPVLADLHALEWSGAKILQKDESLGVGYARVTKPQQRAISRYMHDHGKCAGFQVLPDDATAESAIAQLSALQKKDLAYSQSRAATPRVTREQKIVDALAKLNASNIQNTVQWLSSFPSRYNKLRDPNQHVNQMETRLRDMLKNFKGKWTVQQITHRSTQQHSLMARIEGASRPNEIIVLGGHLDSINQWGGGAPGADDNASGSASLMEALRLVIETGATERSLEFFWYAGEESGLLGSGEIAKQYKVAGKNVVAVLQLDMTLMPGSGELSVANIDDYTSPWLRDYLVALNQTYLNVSLISDHCGYACSDHASWYREGYPTLMPFESHTNNMNSNIHTDRDVIGSSSSFTHALIFAKIALAMAMDLGNSTAHQPY